MNTTIQNQALIQKPTITTWLHPVPHHHNRKREAMATYARTCLMWLDDDPMTRVQLDYERMYLRLSRDDAQTIEAAVLAWSQQPQKRELAELLEASELVEVGDARRN